MSHVQDIIKAASTSGLVGVSAYGVSLVLAHYGVVIPPEQLVTIIGLLAAMAGHIHFSALKTDKLKQQIASLDVTVRNTAQLLPQTYDADDAGHQQYP